MTLCKLIISLSTFIFLSQATKAQSEISGTIKTQDKQVTPTATVTLQKLPDSSVVRTISSEKDGSYSFNNIDNGSYFLSVSSVGYKKFYSSPFKVTAERKKINLPPIQLAPANNTLAGVTVTASRPLIEQKIDRTVLNVEAAVTNAGSNVLEVLERAPGLMVDKDGNISLKGKEGVIVMIDGRPTQLGGADLANMLRNMNASQIDQVELMTNPPARFDASGNAGVINIKTKKIKTTGYAGSLNLNYTQGRYPKTSEGFDFSYRDGKVNLFTSLNHNYRMLYEQLTIQRKILDNGAVKNYFDQKSESIKEGSSYNGRLGLDYSMNKKTTIGVLFTGMTMPQEAASKNTTTISTPLHHLEGTTLASVTNTSTWKNYSGNFNFRTLLNTTGRELTADIDYINYDVRNRQWMTNSYLDESGRPLPMTDSLLGALPQQIGIYSARVDYVHPVNKNLKWEAGIKTSFVKTDNNVLYDSIQNGTMVRDLNRSNHFIYEENINAAYLNFTGTVSKKINTQLGLRMENTIANGQQLTTHVNFDRSYTQLFPTAYLQYKLNDKNNLGLNYGRRIRRPNYESLNPFIRFIDRYTYSQGNPELKPQFSNSIELSHSFKNFITTTFNYSSANNIIGPVLEQKGREAYMKQSNLSTFRQYGVSLNINKALTNWWNGNLFINYFTNKYDGYASGSYVSFAASRLIMNTNQQFKISRALSADLNAIYRSAGMESVARMKASGMLAAGFSQQLWKNKGSLRLTVRDILYTQKADAVLKYSNVDAAFQEIRDTRVINLGFTYRFSKGKINNSKKKQGSAGEEQNRVGVDQ